MNIINPNSMNIFICIGSNKLNGDLLGPLVGTYLRKKYLDLSNIKVFGDINNPINFNNIDEILETIDSKYSNRCIRIMIDSALGNRFGDIVIKKGNLDIGQGLNKSKKIKGNIYIKGVVGKNHNDAYKNLIELKNSEFNKINEMALEISNIIV